MLAGKAGDLGAIVVDGKQRKASRRTGRAGRCGRNKQDSAIRKHRRIGHPRSREGEPARLAAGQLRIELGLRNSGAGMAQPRNGRSKHHAPIREQRRSGSAARHRSHHAPMTSADTRFVDLPFALDARSFPRNTRALRHKPPPGRRRRGGLRTGRGRSARSTALRQPPPGFLRDSSWSNRSRAAPDAAPRGVCVSTSIPIGAGGSLRPEAAHPHKSAAQHFAHPLISAPPVREL